MKTPMFALIIFAVVGLGIAGIVFLGNAVSAYNEPFGRHDVLTPAFIAGIICLVIATGILILGVVLAMFQKRDSVNDSAKERDTSFTVRDRV